MFWNLSPAAACGAWRAEVEFAQEAGDTPLIEVGGGLHLLASLSSAPVAEHFVEQRADVTSPLILAGGWGDVWLSLLFTAPSQRQAVGATIVFAGCDAACRMASVATATGARSSLRSTPGNVMAGAVELLIPDSRPGATESWDRLPMWALEEGQGWRPIEDAPPHVDLQAWLAGGLILFMIAVALLAGALINATPSI